MRIHRFMQVIFTTDGMESLDMPNAHAMVVRPACFDDQFPASCPTLPLPPWSSPSSMISPPSLLPAHRPTLS
jgi:hypothetical protein